MTDTDALFQFPCEFPIKVMGRDSESFRTLTLAIIERHAGALAPDRISELYQISIGGGEPKALARFTGDML